MNFYVKLVLVSLILVGIAQFVPELVNWLLLVVLVSLVILQANQFAALIAALKL